MVTKGGIEEQMPQEYGLLPSLKTVSSGGVQYQKTLQLVGSTVMKV